MKTSTTTPSLAPSNSLRQAANKIGIKPAAAYQRHLVAMRHRAASGDGARVPAPAGIAP